MSKACSRLSGQLRGRRPVKRRVGRVWHVGLPVLLKGMLVLRLVHLPVVRGDQLGTFHVD